METKKYLHYTELPQATWKEISNWWLYAKLYLETWGDQRNAISVQKGSRFLSEHPKLKQYPFFNERENDYVILNGDQSALYLTKEMPVVIKWEPFYLSGDIFKVELVDGFPYLNVDKVVFTEVDELTSKPLHTIVWESSDKNMPKIDQFFDNRVTRIKSYLVDVLKWTDDEE